MVLKFYLYFLIAIIVSSGFGCTEEIMPLNLPMPVYSATDSLIIQGKVYKTVKIGNQWWMAENLAVTKYNDGSDIPNIQVTNTQNVDTVWSADTLGAFQVYYPNSSVKINGRYFYNWYAVNNSKKIAPDGWHVSTDADWKELEQYLGLEAGEVDRISWRGAGVANKLKSDTVISKELAWQYYSDKEFPTNISGFSAYPYGCRLFNGITVDQNVDIRGYWWTSYFDSLSVDLAWYRYMDYKEDRVFRHSVSKNYGFNVRCVKDRE